MNVNQETDGPVQPTLEQLDTWCEQALSSASSEAREEAERRLRYFFPTFSETQAELSDAYGISSGQERVLAVFPTIKGPADAARLMTWFLHQSAKVYSQTYVVRRLRTLVLNHLGVMADDQKSALRVSLLEAIREKGSEMPAFLVDDITRTLALVVMFTWFDMSESRDVIDQVLEGAVHRVLALQMLRAFVEEFNRELPARYIARQRRVVVAFRDKQLKAIFAHALEAMRAATPAPGSDTTAEQRQALSQSLLLQRDCLGFDFIGLAPDEASDDAVAIQIPSTWKDVVQVDGFLDAYFDGYARSGPPISSQFIEVLVQVASIRRSFYMEAVRVQFVRRMARGISEILSGTIGLEDVENYHHLCRLLARFRCIHTLVEIEDAAEYRDLLAAVASFTMTGLTLWEWSPNSIAPLLTFWAKVAATHDVRDDSNAAIAGDVISETLPRVVREFLRAMVAATARAADSGDSPLDNTDLVLENMSSVAAIARASYERCAPVVLETLREMAAEYQEMLRTGQDVTVVELQLAWPVYAVALCISARQPYRSLPEDDRRDADMFATALELDRLVQQRIQSNISTPPCESLELALLQTHVAFRSSFIGEGGHKVTAVFAQLSSLVGLPDGAAVLDLILQKVLFNLRSWPAQSPVVHRSLQLFHDMTAGYVSVRQVAKLDTITLLLANHSSEQLQFLHSIDEYKQRALYYGGLARVLFASDTPSPAQFVEFMHPWTATVDELLEMPEEQLVQDAVRPNLIRVLRDLRGFLAAISSKNNFMRFFEWLMPQRIELVHRAVRMGRDSHVQIAGLKFLAEFAYNRTQRLNFDVSSANGILIFREASQAIWEYGRLAIDSREPVRNVYKERYKGVAVCFTTLMRLVAGKYVAIGVMPLYGDVALERAYQTVLELLRQFPIADVIAYPKLGKATMSMLEVLLAKNNIDLVQLTESAHEQTMRLCVEAFDHAETAVSSAACSVIDGLLTAAIECADAGRSQKLVELVQARPDITQHLLKTMLNIVLFEDRPNDWSFSRPLFCLMVLHREFALQYTSQIVQYQPVERRGDLIAALKDLLSSTELVLTTANRDAFTQALTHYRREVTAKNLILMVPSTQTLGAPVDIMKSTDTEAQEAMAE
ncbi:hypothetical protein LPJ77_002467 [Coemansia sp. RSA 2523]|nr:hypothetical protein LPJ58_001493 [Coemansia sp. RSA 1591]KAJ1777972.1 hypothetical protein LPJ54_002030 [Coemansia sp. RSA 1824]KAJ1808263.1 hypothetical protein LPJ77_002467 [Coemansia sp. RSA 2523]KAJ2132072.1 hypothetical protein GGF48_001173 [Coemansia sp. RSA 921]KAJ2187308.1 hypothetical protein EV181_002831 [Coemansia sp. RSA 532]KAJ2201586.1 hypothetical protein IW144_000196 [Coemansia sp. RSA 522]KAJ2207595.1 hypothetical protein IW145_001349 [Coemansia sp. RSA 521]KAJ2272356.1 